MIIGVAGLLGSGKDTTANMLKGFLSELGYSYELNRFAALLKEATRLVFGDNFDDRDVKEEAVFVTYGVADKIIDSTDYVSLKLDLTGSDFELYTALCVKHIDSKSWISPREFQQILGTDVVRSVGKDIWVDYAKSKFHSNTIVTDVRFENEAKVCDVLINVVRKSVSEKCSDHVSEELAHALCNNYVMDGSPKIITVYNNGTLQDLETNVKFATSVITHMYKD